MNHNQAPKLDSGELDTWNRERSEQKMRSFVNDRLKKLVEVDIDA